MTIDATHGADIEEHKAEEKQETAFRDFKITKQLLESKYTRVNSYQLERERRKQELEAKTAALQLDESKKSLVQQASAKLESEHLRSRRRKMSVDAFEQLDQVLARKRQLLEAGTDASEAELLRVQGWQVECIDDFARHKLNNYTGNVSRKKAFLKRETLPV